MNVLAAIDFGESSLEALRQARALAHGVGSSLSTCHVLPAPHDLSALFPARFPSSSSGEEEARIRKALEERARSELGLELSDIRILRGTPYAEIVRCAEEVHAGYVVVGTHGRTGLAHALLGSVAEQVVRHAHCSVLVARRPEKAGVVVAATDLSPASLPVIAEGYVAAKRSGARLVVVSVVDWGVDLGSAVSGLVGVMPTLPPAELRTEVHGALETAVNQAMTQIGASGEVRVLDGSPAAQIVNATEELGAELLVVGTRGRTGLARLALGSVAERVVRGAKCPVLAVRVRS